MRESSYLSLFYLFSLLTCMNSSFFFFTCPSLLFRCFCVVASCFTSLNLILLITPQYSFFFVSETQLSSLGKENKRKKIVEITGQPASSTKMTSLLTAAIAYGSSVVTVFTLYPYRDLVKAFDMQHPPRFGKMGDFCMKRYKGMLGSPSQPLLLGTPQAALYFGYVLGAGGASGAIVGGFLFGYTKMFVRTVAHRMNGGATRYNKLEQRGYSGVLDCITSSAKHFGVLSFFPGALAAAIIGTLWYGISLAVLQQTYSSSFGGDLWNAFRIHALMTFFTTPLRNSMRSAMYHSERSGGLHSFHEYVAAETAVFREAGGIFRTMAREEGLRFFLHGVVRTMFKSSVPFAVTYALFKAVGGSIGYPSGGGNRGGHTGRHFSRRF